MGAVIGTLVAESIVLILYFYFSKKVIDLKKVVFPGLLFLIAGIIMDIALEFLKNRMPVESLFVRLVIEVCIGGAIYCTITFLGIILPKRNSTNRK